MSTNEPEPTNEPKRESPKLPTVPQQKPGQQFEEKRGVEPDRYQRKAAK